MALTTDSGTCYTLTGPTSSLDSVPCSEVACRYGEDLIAETRCQASTVRRLREMCSFVRAFVAAFFLIAYLSAGAVSAQVCNGPVGWDPTGQTTNDPLNCLNLFACYPPQLGGVTYESVGGCDPTAGPCAVRAQVRATFRGNHLNQGSFVGTPVMFTWSDGGGGFVGSCGNFVARIFEDIGDAWISASNFSCDDPQAATGTDDFTLRVQVCNGATGCTQSDVNVPVPLTPEAMSAALCPQPPPDFDCDACGGCMGPGSGAPPGSSGGSGGSNAAGGPPVTSGGGPGAHLRYRGGGVGHPSYPGATEHAQRLGRYWAHSYSQRLVEVASPAPNVAEAWLLTDRGTFVHFVDPNGSGYDTITPGDDYRTLTAVVGGWELADLDGTVMHFDTDGLWTMTVDRNGNTVSATYDGSDNLTQVDFPDGRSETFAYHPGGKLASITEVGVDGTTTRTWSTTWTGENLTRIDHPDGRAVEYLYDDVRYPGYLTRSTLVGTDNSERILASFEYDGAGNVVRSWRGDTNPVGMDAVDVWQFAFDNPALPTETTVTDPLGNTSVYTFATRSSKGEKPRIVDLDGDCPTACTGPNVQRSYDDPANLYRPTEEIDGHGHRTIYTYDLQGMVTSRTEAFMTPLERETTWQYDANFPAFRDEISRPSTTGGAMDFRITTLGIDPLNGNETSRTEDGFEDGSPFTLVTSKTYNAAGRVLTVDPPGHGSSDVTTFTYDPTRGDLIPTTRIDPLVGTTTFGYDAFNRQSSETDPNGVVTELQYDDLDRLQFHIRKAASPADDLITEHRYNVFGDLLQTVFPEGNVVEYGYDSAGRLTSIERKPDDQATSHGERVVYTLDGFGHRVSESLQRWDDVGMQWVEHNVTDYVYSTRCHLDQRIDGAGSANESVTEFAYDCEGLLIEEWDANHPSSGQTLPPSKSYFYDELNRLETVQQPWGGAGGGTVQVDYGYDVQDHLASVTDGEGNVTTYTTSDRDLMTEEQSPVSGITTYTYGDHGQLVTRTDARGVVETRTVDEADRTTFVDFADPALDITYTWDDVGVPFSAGRLTSIERDGQSLDFEYDRFGRMTRDGDLTYAYDKNGNRTEITYLDGGVARYTLDFADRDMTLEYEPLGGSVQQIVTAATYQPSGPLDSLSFDNGVTETRTYDERYHPDRVTASGPSGTLLDWDYATDGVGNPTDIDDLVNGGPSNRNYTYQDIQYYLTSGNGPWGTRSWTYDRIGNRLTATAGGGPADTYIYVAGVSGNTAILDEIQLGAGGTRQYDFGAAGHLEQITEGADQLALSSDEAGRLAHVSGMKQTGLRYDGRSFLAESVGAPNEIFADDFEDGNLACWSAVSGGSLGGTCTAPPVPPRSTTEPVYSSEGVVHALINTEDANQRSRTHFYFGGRVVAQLESSLGGDIWTFLTADHLGTPAASTDLLGAQVWQGGFEPFGADWQAGTANGASENGLQLRLPGQWDDETWAGAGIFYNVHRWLQAATGSYTRVDPLGLVDRAMFSPKSAQGSQLELVFGYAQMNPLLRFDRLGEKSRVCCRKIPKLPGDFRHCAIQIERNGSTTTCGLFGGRYTPGEQKGVGQIRPDHDFDRPGSSDLDCGPWSEGCEADDCVVGTANGYANPSKYRAVRGPNSNTFAGTIARACGLKKPDTGSTPGWNDPGAPPKAGTKQVPGECKLP